MFYLFFLVTSAFSSVTHDIDQTLTSVIERDKLHKACHSYFKAPTPQNEILCGKSIFFNLETRTDLGIPNQMLGQLKKSFPTEFNKVGFQRDPHNENEKLGLVKVKPLHPEKLKDLLSLNNIRQISCAACHVGQMPDGRWSVGYPNYQLNIGQLNTLFSFPLWLADSRKHDSTRWLPKLTQKYEQMRKVVFKKPLQNWMLIASSLPAYFNQSKFFFRFLEQDPPSLGDQKSFIYSRPGVYNAASPIISFGDREFYSTPPQIWNLDHRTHKDEAYLGTITSVDTLEAFIKHAYVYTNLTSIYSKDKYVKPLASYLRSLKTPKYLGKIDSFKAQRGGELFKSKCISCHDGRNGASLKRYSVETVGTPKELDSIFHDYNKPSQQSEKLMVGLQEAHPFEPITFGVKARRLNGIWSKTRLMTNGSIDGLDHLFCLNGKKRKKAIRPQMTELVHEDLCHLDQNEKLELKEYLLTL